MVADVPLGVGRAAGFAGRVRHVAVRRLAVEDPIAADHAGEADVDDASRGLQVEPDPEAAEEDRGAG